jgi:Na+/proline symporter
VILYPNLADKESGYVKAFVDYLPTPWKGVMMAGFAAAYMSTVGTHLNWGASYLVNDFYKRFLKPNESQHHYVKVGRIATVLLFIASVGVTSQLSSVEQAWKFLLALGAGTGLVLILRWYWSRINAWSEISAMIASFVVSSICFKVVPGRFAAGDPNADATIMLITVAVSTVIWLTVTFITSPEPDSVLDSFYRRVRPGGPGWRRVAERNGFGAEGVEGGILPWTNWIAGIVAVYCSLFGIGKIIFGQTMMGVILIVVALLALLWISRSFREGAMSRSADIAKAA